MRIGYCLPYGVQNTEANDFLKERVLTLSAKAEIILFSPFKFGGEGSLDGIKYHLLDDLDDASLRGRMDLLAFRLGEDPHLYTEIIKMQKKYPGVVELDEICLQDKMLSTSENGEHMPNMCLIGQAIENARGVIVRSEFAKQLVLGQRPEVPVESIPFCDARGDAAKYIEFFQQIVDHTWLPDQEDRLVGWICELGLTDEEYVRHVAQMVEPLMEAELAYTAG